MRSDNVTKGAERAPNRSLFYALGYTPRTWKSPSSPWSAPTATSFPAT